MAKTVTLKFIVPIGYMPGDYAVLCGNGGSGEIDWDTPLSEVIDLFPGGAGIYGWGQAPWGNHRWGRPHSMLTPGWGQLPWGMSPWGYGSVMISYSLSITDCGEYKFAFACYDAFGNLHQGTPETVTIHMHIAPPAPLGLKKYSYDKDTDILILQAA